MSLTQSFYRQFHLRHVDSTKQVQCAVECETQTERKETEIKRKLHVLRSVFNAGIGIWCCGVCNNRMFGFIWSSKLAFFSHCSKMPVILCLLSLVCDLNYIVLLLESFILWLPLCFNMCTVAHTHLVSTCTYWTHCVCWTHCSIKFRTIFDFKYKIAIAVTIGQVMHHINSMHHGFFFV